MWWRSHDLEIFVIWNYKNRINLSISKASPVYLSAFEISKINLFFRKIVRSSSQRVLHTLWPLQLTWSIHSMDSRDQVSCRQRVWKQKSLLSARKSWTVVSWYHNRPGQALRFLRTLWLYEFTNFPKISQKIFFWKKYHFYLYCID